MLPSSPSMLSRSAADNTREDSKRQPENSFREIGESGLDTRLRVAYYDVTVLVH